MNKTQSKLMERLAADKEVWISWRGDYGQREIAAARKLQDAGLVRITDIRTDAKNRSTAIVKNA